MTPASPHANPMPATVKRSLFSRFMSSLREAFRVKTEQDRLEAYLADSADIYELEARMRAWDNETRHR